MTAAMLSFFIAIEAFSVNIQILEETGMDILPFVVTVIIIAMAVVCIYDAVTDDNGSRKQ